MSGLSKTIRSILLFLLFTGNGILFSQVPVTRSENKVIIEGNVYFVHIVKPGQTLFSISKAYGVTEKDIAIENPGVYAGLQVGQVLKIPADIPKDRQSTQDLDTTRYFIHPLQAGETIFSLSKKYNVTVEGIIEANPDIDISDLSIGQKINIPRLKTVWKEEDFDLHKVRRRETLYSLSKRYSISEQEIRDYNPELQWGGLRTGQVIRIPKQEFLMRKKEQDLIAKLPLDTIVTDSLYQSEEYSYIDSLGLKELSIEDYYFNLKQFNRRKLNVAFLIPFNYREEIDTLIVDPDDPKLKEENQDKEEQLYLPRSINFLEFFEGSLLALDSLRKEGVGVNAKFFDTQKSPSKVREVLNSPFFKDVDLIIGPFFSFNVEIVSEFSRENKIPLISPFYEGIDITNRNPYLFQVSPSYQTEYQKAADILSREYDKNFIFIYRKDSLKFNEIEYFKTRLLLKLREYNHTENIVIKEIYYENPTKANLSADLSHAFSSDKKNIVILPENDEAFVSTVITQLYYQLPNQEIEVFGLPYFNEFQNIDFQYYHALRLRYLTPFYFDYADPQIEYFITRFRENFKSEPRLSTKKGCPYAFIGYDLTYFFIRNMYRWDKRFISHLNSGEIDNLLPDFNFQRNTPFGGFENQDLRMVRFDVDLSVHEEPIRISKAENDLQKDGLLKNGQ